MSKLKLTENCRMASQPINKFSSSVSLKNSRKPVARVRLCHTVPMSLSHVPSSARIARATSVGRALFPHTNKPITHVARQSRQRVAQKLRCFPGPGKYKGWFIPLKF
ncbi:hypothetical protein AVEN_114723-1 [Araneus ventricosus]|uniref:Uncharacterized protein n=1 Tax=Araneus ventricosus TaxID=182803 RepID=A0A4Y2WMU1_ARAVE|nr:hypothetical protein AVEN_114723-1 [Araneus ventricosus]